MEPAVWDRIKSTVLYLKKKGVRVDAIGWQAHLKDNDNVGLDPEALKYLGELIDWTHSQGMEFHVTEMDYKLKGDFDETNAQKQAFAVTNVLKVLLSKRNSGVVTFNFWGLQDGNTKFSDGYRNLFDEQLKAKPVFYATQKTLENPDDLKLLFNIPEQPVTGADFDGGLIKNGSFEDNFNGWSKWGETDIDNDAHTGEFCAVLGSKTGVKQTIKNLNPNTKYLLSAYMKNDPGDKIVLKVTIEGEPKPKTTKFEGAGYEKVELTFTTSGKKSIVVLLQKFGNTDKGKSRVDDVSLVVVQ
jgi:hypothetical protein